MLVSGAVRVRETHDKDDNDYDPGGCSDNEEGVRGRDLFLRVARPMRQAHRLAGICTATHDLLRDP